MSVEESELWFWSYLNEVIHESGRQRAHYELVRDEDVIQDPVAIGRSLYEACGLDWEASVERNLLRWATPWRERTARWTDLTEPHLISLVEEILADGIMKDWWDDDQIVSRFDYQWK